MINLHESQSKIFNTLFINRAPLSDYSDHIDYADNTKNIDNGVGVCSRGFGKSFLGATAASAAAFELLELDLSVPNKNVYVIAPTYSQVTDIYFPLLNYQFNLESHCISTSRDTGRFQFPKGVMLRLVSYEAIERLRGTGAYFVLNDEVCDWTKGVGLKDAWESILQPCIVSRWSPMKAMQYGAKAPGRSLTIGTPKGFNYFYDMFNMSENDPRWYSWQFDYSHSPELDAHEIERIRHTIDPLKYNREYRARFEDSGNNVFYCFNRKVHVRSDIEALIGIGDKYVNHEGKSKVAERAEDVNVSVDFNVGIMASSVFGLRGKQMQFMDEFKGHPDTEQLCIAIRNRYPKERFPKVNIYPDPSGKARKTSAPVGTTDFSIMRSFGFNVYARDKAPPISDSVNAVNARLMTAAGDVNMYVHPKCSGLITSLERTVWLENNPDSAQIDKTEGVEHFSDGVRYAAEWLFPIQTGTKTTARGFGF